MSLYVTMFGVSHYSFSFQHLCSKLGATFPQSVSPASLVYFKVFCLAFSKPFVSLISLPIFLLLLCLYIISLLPFYLYLFSLILFHSFTLFNSLSLSGVNALCTSFHCFLSTSLSIYLSSIPSCLFFSFSLFLCLNLCYVFLTISLFPPLPLLLSFILSISPCLSL